VKRRHIGVALLIGAIFTGMLAIRSAAESNKTESTQTIRQGQQTFARYCASCHSVHSAASLTGPGFKGYYSTHQPRPPDVVVRAVIAKGKGKMPAFGNLNKTQTDEVIAYLKTL